MKPSYLVTRRSSVYIPLIGRISVAGAWGRPVTPRGDVQAHKGARIGYELYATSAQPSPPQWRCWMRDDEEVMDRYDSTRVIHKPIEDDRRLEIGKECSEITRRIQVERCKMAWLQSTIASDI